MAETLIKNVSDTAFLVAAFRAIETENPHGLFRDPLAWRLAGEHGKKMAEKAHGSLFGGWVIVIRTVIIDDFIMAALEQGVDTVLNLGAGLDTRPYRMQLPESLPWIEVDYPHVVELKESKLAGEKPRCKLERVKMDLADVGARRKLFAELNSKAKKVLVLTEGVVPYLSNEEAGGLADDLNSCANFRYWITDYLSPAGVRFRQKKARVRQMQNAPLKFNPEDWFAFFAGHGWKSTKVRYLADEARHLKRPLPLPRTVRLWMKVKRLFTLPKNRVAFQKSAAYVLLEPG